MPEKTIRRRLQDAGDATLASDDGPIFSTVAKLVEARITSRPAKGRHKMPPRLFCAMVPGYGRSRGCL